MMSTESSVISTKETVGSLDTVLLPRSNKRWEQDNQETQGVQQNYRFGWYHEGTGFSAAHMVHMYGSFDSPSMIARLICFRILERLPDDAVFEAQETLVKIREFYQLPSAIEQPNLPLPTRNATFLPTIPSVDYPWDDDKE